MSEPVTVALVGIGGYGANYLKPFLQEPHGLNARLVAVIDPFAASSPHLAALQSRQIPLFPDLAAFYAAHTAELVVISTPIALHCPQTCEALAHGSNVLCEKPVSATIQDALAMQAAATRAGRFAAIGYQWSFSEAVQKLKRDILAGDLGAPRQLRTMVSWPRSAGYYKRNNWAGAQQTANGTWVLDSPINNATAHYLHNMFFVLGDTLSTSARPRSLQGELYRANPITNFDAGAVRITTDKGVELLFLSAHPVSEVIGPVARYTFEKAVVTIDENSATPGVFVARFNDGTVRDYGSPGHDVLGKLRQCLDAVRSGAPVCCDVAAATSQTLVVNGLQDSTPITPFPAELIRRMGEPGDELTYVQDLHTILTKCYERGVLPSELGTLSWARAGRRIDLGQYNHFPGGKAP